MIAAPPWNRRLSELVKQSCFADVITLFLGMIRAGVVPDAFTYPFVFKACGIIDLPVAGAQLHCRIIKSGCMVDPFVHSSMLTSFCRCRSLEDARRLFDEGHVMKSLTVSYNALISGYVWNSRVLDAILLFKEMRENSVKIDEITCLGLAPALSVPDNLILGLCVHGFWVKLGFDLYCSVGNCLLTMYMKNGKVCWGRKVFDEMPQRGLITWNAIINGFAQNGLCYDVLKLYKGMKQVALVPDPMTIVGVLSACANLGARRFASEVEQDAETYRLKGNPFISTALISMHCRCGNLIKAREIFDHMQVKTVVAWTALISGYGMHGQGDYVVNLFDEMISCGVTPDRTVFTCVLSACSHAGLTKDGLQIFDLMKGKYNLLPGPEHYACVVDLLGRAGRLCEALQLIESMEVKPDAAVWGSLLGACKIHQNDKLGKLAFEHAIELEPANTGYYVLMFNIYTDSGNKEGMVQVRAMMRERQLRKEPGCSYIEVKGTIHQFLVGDRSHPRTNSIYAKLEELENLVMTVEADNMNQEIAKEKQAATAPHSEKLALSFGILNAKPGDDIIIMKNLRICCDCHWFIKAVSSVVTNQFVVRDASRFHHFKGGVCSCKDYW